ADHAVLDAALGAKEIVLALKPLDVPRVVERDGGDAGDDRDEAELILVEVRARVRRRQVDDADRATEEHERHAYKRAEARDTQAFGSQIAAAFDEIVRE